MNRRQFLGRVFQSVISLHNSYSYYGIYHPWRQYQDIRTHVNIYFEYRTGKNPNYDPTNQNSEEYLTSYIPYTGQYGPIIALYKGNEMIYCSAYKNGDTIRNSAQSNVRCNLLPGTYTIKVLSLGKGLVLGPSGQSMTFEIPEVDRKVDPYTGGYNKYNNYGYISSPDMTITFLFDYEGLSFDLEFEYIEHGKDLRGVPGIDVVEYKYPTPDEVNSAVQAVGQTYGKEWGYSYDTYMDNNGFWGTNGGPIPYEYILQYVDIPIREERRYLTIYSHNGLDNKTLRGKIDVTHCTDSTLTSAACYQLYTKNGLDYNPATDYYIGHSSGFNVDRGQILHEWKTIDGTAINYAIKNEQMGELLDANPQCGVKAVLYPLAAISDTRAFKRSVGYFRKGSVSIKASLDPTGDPAEATTESVPVFYANFNQEYYKFRYRSNGTSGYIDELKEFRDGQYHLPYAPDPYTPANGIKTRMDAALEYDMPQALAARTTALENWGKTVADNVEYYYERIYKPYNDLNDGMTIPLDLIFSKIPSEKFDYPVRIYDYSENQGFEVKPWINTEGEAVSYSVDYKTPGSSKYVYYKTGMHKSLPTPAEVDLTDYEFCMDYSTGWVNTNSNPLVLRQTVIDIDLSEVPDHQISIN